MVRHRVLVVEDEADMRRYYVWVFGRHPREFSCLLAQDGDQALSALAGEDVDVVVLDWVLPGLPGSAVLRALRGHPKTRATSVLVVTGAAAPRDAAEILEAGADDYLAKPLDERVFLARLRSLRRRRELLSAERQLFELPGLSWDAPSGRLLIEGRHVHLTPKESDLLGIFLERPNMIHVHRFLWDSVWGGQSEAWEHIVVSAVCSLRRKLGSRWGPRLENVKGRGFYLNTGNRDSGIA